MALFLQTYIGHLLGDFVFQPGRLVVAKRKAVAGMLLHVTIVTACTALVMFGDLGRLWYVVVASGVAHLGIEYLTVRARRTNGASGLRLFLLDQALHVTSLALIALSFEGELDPSLLGRPAPIAILAAVAGVGTVAFLGSILSFEVRMAAAKGESVRDPILKLDLPRVYGMVERGMALAVALVSPMPALGALAFAPRIVLAFAQPPVKRAGNAIDAAVGFCLCVAAWVAVALLFEFAG